MADMSAATGPAACPHCNDSGWIAVDNERNISRPCNCQGDTRRRQRLAGAMIPKRYEHCTLETFRASDVVLKNAKARVEEFVGVWPNVHGRGLLITGPPGSGKTHLAVSALLEIVNDAKPGRVLFRNFQDLIFEIQATFESDQQVTKLDIMRPVVECDLLVLDELGSQKPTNFVTDILYYLINTRYNEERATIFTTNYGETAADAGKETLEQRIGDRMRSRLAEMAQRISLEGTPDYRRNVL